MIRPTAGKGKSSNERQWDSRGINASATSHSTDQPRQKAAPSTPNNRSCRRVAHRRRHGDCICPAFCLRHTAQREAPPQGNTVGLQLMHLSHTARWRGRPPSRPEALPLAGPRKTPTAVDQQPCRRAGTRPSLRRRGRRRSHQRAVRALSCPLHDPLPPHRQQAVLTQQTEPHSPGSAVRICPHVPCPTPWRGTPQ